MDGTTGWVAQSQLAERRTAMVMGEGTTPMRAGGEAGAKIRWTLQPGVIGTLGDCENRFCELDVKGHKGWVDQTRLFGPGEP